MNQNIFTEDQVSTTIDNDEICSDSSANSRNIDSDRFGVFLRNGLVKIEELGFEDSIIRTSFYSGIVKNSEFAKETKIVAIHKNLNSNWSGKARIQSFGLFSKAVADKCGTGDANIKYAWYGASRDEIFQIVTHGFSWSLKDRGCCRHGNGVSLSSAKFSFDR